MQYSLGFAGRPSSSDFYISTVDNTENHGKGCTHFTTDVTPSSLIPHPPTRPPIEGPGSQGSKTEADACFAKVVGAAGRDSAGPSIDTVKRLGGQPGAKPPNGFVGSKANYIEFESFKLLRP